MMKFAAFIAGRWSRFNSIRPQIPSTLRLSAQKYLGRFPREKSDHGIRLWRLVAKWRRHTTKLPTIEPFGQVSWSARTWEKRIKKRKKSTLSEGEVLKQDADDVTCTWLLVWNTVVPRKRNTSYYESSIVRTSPRPKNCRVRETHFMEQSNLNREK